MKIKTLLLSTLGFTALHFSPMAQTVNLFDGKTTDGWHVYLGKGPGADQ